jgi:hypothetical protein
MGEESGVASWGKVLERAAPGSRPNLERTLLMPTVHVENPATAGVLLRACLEEFRELAERVATLERALEASITPLEHDPEPLQVALSHTQLVCRSSGYSFQETDGPRPSVGELVEISGEFFAVDRVVPSLYPDDTRCCAVLVPATAGP